MKTCPGVPVDGTAGPGAGGVGVHAADARARTTAKTSPAARRAALTARVVGAFRLIVSGSLLDRAGRSVDPTLELSHMRISDTPNSLKGTPGSHPRVL
jgi:hypothetical protein